jgi:hypothetical protein
VSVLCFRARRGAGLPRSRVRRAPPPLSRAGRSFIRRESIDAREVAVPVSDRHARQTRHPYTTCVPCGAAGAKKCRPEFLRWCCEDEDLTRSSHPESSATLWTHKWLAGDRGKSDSRAPMGRRVYLARRVLARVCGPTRHRVNMIHLSINARGLARSLALLTTARPRVEQHPGRSPVAFVTRTLSSRRVGVSTRRDQRDRLLAQGANAGLA